MSGPASSVRALLGSLIDYAGLFPPAKLDMTATVENYAAYLKSDEGWMLGRLIIPVSRLEEFEHAARELLPHQEDGSFEPWQLSALTGPAENAQQLAADMQLIEEFNLRHEDPAAGLACIDVLEVKAESAGAIETALEQMPGDIFPFFELPVESDPRGLIAALAEGDAGAKARTGGAAASAYPSPAHLARFVAACAAADVPFKATAGLHHPLRHFSDAVGVKEFGFLNVFIGGCLAHAFELPESELAEILEAESINHFAFDEAGLAWRGLRLTSQQVEDVRDGFATSFGSCSFDEPVEGLRSLNLLAK